jgi:hypothetical protein
MRNLRKFAVAALAASIAAIIGGSAWNLSASSFLAVADVKFRDPAAGNMTADTTFLTDEADTLRTVGISTADWDWDTIARNAGQVATGGPAARVYFWSSTGTNNGATDSIYYTIEKSHGRDSSFTYNGSLAAAVGSCAIADGTAGAAVNVWVGTLKADPDSPGINDIWMAPYFRLKIAGDQSGTTPKVSGLRCVIVYPKRAESQ